MKISLNQHKNTPKSNFKGIYNNKMLFIGLKFAADNSALFCATTSLALSTIARPAAILSTPKTDKKNKRYACAKSLASSAVGYLIMFAASNPVARAIKKIDSAPSDFLNKSTIKNLQSGSKTLLKSNVYQFATQLFKLGLGFVIAVPKSALTCFLIPPVMNLLFKNDNKSSNDKTKANSSIISFKGLYNSATEKIAAGIGKILNTKPVQKFAQKYADTNFAQHIMNMTDVVLTASFINRTAKSKKIENDRKKALIYNSAISTGLSITGGYAIHHYTRKPTEKFIQKFKEANKNSPLLEKYIEGIKIAKPALILGGIYYIFIPIISTFLADRADKKHNIKLY